jgi:hypothetical protein
MINLDNITLVSVSSVKIDETLHALRHSCKDISFKSVKFLTDSEITCDDIEIVKIPKIDSVDEYSKFMIYDLDQYIDTEFALVVQYDGYVLNPELWTDDFLRYDYIGAPFPLPSDNFSYRDSFGNIVRVGNGGFSLRSKKLISLPNRLNLPWKSYFGYYNEDGFIVCHNRHIYEENGCKFAPIDVASKFSYENTIFENKGIKPFGFHKHLP